nr:hypothetical protein [Rubritepida sp.]
MSVTLASMGFNGFIGAGLAPTPASGQLDSDFWRIDAASGGLSDYGATQGTGTFGRGAFTAANNPTTGGVYALDRGAGDAAFAIQQSGSAFVPSGTVTLRVQHTGPSPLTSLSFDFEGLFRNNADRGTQVTFSYAVQSAATEPASFTTLGDLGFLTPTALTAGASFTFLDLPAQTVAATV